MSESLPQRRTIFRIPLPLLLFIWPCCFHRRLEPLFVLRIDASLTVRGGIGVGVGGSWVLLVQLPPFRRVGVMVVVRRFRGNVVTWQAIRAD